MPLVTGTFDTLFEAERAVQALLDAGHDPSALRAYGTAGAGRLLLADRVGVRRIGQPAHLADRSDLAGTTAAAAAMLGALLALVVAWLLPKFGIDLLRAPRAYLHDPWLSLAFVSLVGLVFATIGGLSRLGEGLPHNLALRLASRLDQGDFVVGIAVSNATQAKAAQETMLLTGAQEAHITRGTLASTDALDAGEPIGVPASRPD